MKSLTTFVGIAALVATSIVLAVPFYGHMGGRGGMMHGYFNQGGDRTLTTEEIRETRTELFRKYDTDNDGKLVLEELKAAQVAGHQDHVQWILNRHDTDGDSALSLDEYVNGHPMMGRDRYGHTAGYGPNCLNGNAMADNRTETQ